MRTDLTKDIPLVDLMFRVRTTHSSELPRLLGKILIEKGFVKEEQIQEAVERQRQQIATSRFLSQEQMQTLLDLSTIMNSTINPIELLTLIMESANEVVNAEASSLMLQDERTGELVFSVPTGPKKDEFVEGRLSPGEGIAGWVVERGEPLLVADTSKDPRFCGRFDESFDFTSKSILCVPLRVKGKVLGVLEVINKKDGGTFNEADLNLLYTFGDLASIAIENTRLHMEAIERHRLLCELQVAKDIQTRLLPEHPPRMDSLEIGVWIQSALEVSGDFYDFIEVGEDLLGIMVGDVVGKGIPAAILMAAARSVIRSKLEAGCSLSAVMEQVNRTLYGDTTPGTYLTLFCALFNAENRSLTYTNCGHNPAIYLQSRGDAGLCLDVGSTVLGAFEDMTYGEKRMQLRVGDLVVLYTDGITEARSISGEEFGTDRLLECARVLRKETAEDITGGIVEDIKAFTDEMPQRDDQTLMVLKAK
jgi:sigma-B regulation protein RsbU (phosphoserine phosphatase)